MKKKINSYIYLWKKRDYELDIPDEVPDELMNLNLAPSYKAIALAILKNDHSMQSLGFTPKPSKIYSVIKKEEIMKRKDT
jgi:predicted phosphoadenosine phosphosulfate sulfurtransferase